MELRSCSHHLHFIRAIKGGLVTKVLNVTRGRPALKFKEVTDIYDSIMFCNDNVKAERVCAGGMGERTVKAEPEACVCNANDHSICDLDDNGFENITLKQIQERCKTRKRKHSQDIDSSKRKIKIEVSSSLEDYREKQIAPDDSDFMETLSSWRSKLSKNMKTKKRECIKDPLSTYTQEIIPVVKSEEIQTGQEFAQSCEDLVALSEVKSEVPETDCLDHPTELSNVCDISSVCHGLDQYSSIVAEKEGEIARECILENELNYVWEEHADLIPLRMVWASCTDIVVSHAESDQSPNFPAIEFPSEECMIHPDVNYISPPVISLVEDHHSDIHDDQPDGDTLVSVPNVATTHECLDCVDLGYRDDNTFLSDCIKNKFTFDDVVQAKTNSTSEHGFNHGGYLVLSSDDSPKSEEKHSLSSICDDEGKYKTEATVELISWDKHSSSSLHCPKRLLSNRKTISPSSQERLCKAMQLIDIHDKDFSQCRGKLYFGNQTDKKNGTVEGLNVNETMRARFVDNPEKISIGSKSFERGFHPKGILKIPHPSCPASHLSTGCSSVQRCSNSAIAFSKRQMHDVESLAMRLTKELKSMKDIVDDMLRSEFCLNTSLRYKVNEARIAVKNATRAEETAKRSLSIMARNCSRFCKLMKLADNGPAPRDVVPKERKKIAFADEAGGRLCQVRFYEDDKASLSESN